MGFEKAVNEGDLIGVGGRNREEKQQRKWGIREDFHIGILF